MNSKTELHTSIEKFIQPHTSGLQMNGTTELRTSLDTKPRYDWAAG